MADSFSGREALLERIEALQRQAAGRRIFFRGPPAEPTTCCGRGCNGCVWEAYDGALLYWLEDITLLLNT